ncbi:MAG: UDP-2,3-diacylglucosamine diphosphatase LpxI [Pseudomonadota bacterium]
MTGRLALIVGKGALPARVASAQDAPPLIAMLTGNPPDGLEPDLEFRVETIGSLLVDLGKRGVTEVCLCGAIDRPQLDPAALDDETAPLVPLLMQAAGQGDDAALRAIMGLFEQTGFTVRAAHELAPDIVAPPGVLSEKWPDGQMRSDAARGAAILAALAPLDVGQAVVVGQGQVLGIETIAGTDALIAGLPDVPQRAGAVLIKGPKIGQDARADMPTIGPATMTAAHAAGMAGVVIDAGDVILLEPDRCAALADEYGLVLWSRTGD